jgi:hypothetical protein
MRKLVLPALKSWSRRANSCRRTDQILRMQELAVAFNALDEGPYANLREEAVEIVANRVR